MRDFIKGFVIAFLGASILYIGFVLYMNHLCDEIRSEQAVHESQGMYVEANRVENQPVLDMGGISEPYDIQPALGYKALDWKVQL